ncbi:Glycosyltransferase, GT2 family [Tangfeifania diversioriginum]|uniref:Glycosyltransferase, GT2 family n=1 Tax=Tangfeifania diversioriginum TaxID=1168035 RepID=A0A1M6I2K5_9BACT|nr:glycosyltransferase [Tangfeifania diversioriginum]SHJ28610.1 Glycosyltransferase, GT2 family [Tangfeifania diversioriginum]
MELSVIIVNYNVKHFLEQCLHSVQKASKNLDVEIFVVDNNSVDGSSQLVRDKFPKVQLVENKQNVGFSKANNQAVRQAKGKYILLLNPDTVVEEDTFQKVISFMNEKPDAGGLGVKMIDGKGNFLPESKRGLPTPWVAFSKIFGLSKLFPKSKKFGKYHLSYLDENEIHEVDVLAGAFMLLRKAALEKVGLLDETFFMYGEDIDLSYRITQGGYKNYYFPETTIIHYKGESTKKGSLNYVKVFYKAMVIFAQKHFSGGRANIFSILIHLAIYFRAFLSITKRLFDRIFVPLLDAVFIFLGFLFLSPFWENFRYEPGYYPPEFLHWVVPAYIVFWLVSIFFSGGYKKPVSLLNVARGILWGTIAILLVYSLVNEEYRFSRALILLGSAWAAIALFAYRLVFHWLKIKSFGLNIEKTKKIAIAGHPDEAKRVKSVLQQTQIKSDFAGFIALDASDFSEEYIGSVRQLNEIARINRLDEIIFCSGSLSSGEIIRYMLELTSLDIDFKIAPPESVSIIGSNSIHTAGDLYVVHINTISKPSNRHKKRLFDITIAVLLLVFSPLLILFFSRKGRFLKNAFQVFTGKKTWVGYIPDSATPEKLPALKPGILSPADMFETPPAETAKIQQLNILYARDYNVFTDMEIVWKGWKKLDV